MRTEASVLAALCLAVSGCSAQSTAVPAVRQATQQLAFARGPGRYIKHIVIAVQENRSFDNVFDGFPGADTLPYGYMSDGTKQTLQPIPFEVRDMDHGFAAGVMDWNGGKMNQFDLNGT